MSEQTVTLHCGFCEKEHEISVKFPDGWETRYGSVETEDGFCPDHSAIKPFAESQCPGCVGGWGDCPLWKSFAYTSGDGLTEDDFVALESGICPKRVNGTLSFSPAQGMRSIDLRDDAEPAAGRALAKAIKDYTERYKAA